MWYSADGPRNGPVKSVKIQASSVCKSISKTCKKVKSCHKTLVVIMAWQMTKKYL